MEPENIYLIGLMGVGKTTIGKQLAKVLKRPFYDSDKAIEALTGVSIPTIFAIEGEAGFREREHKMIQELTRLQGIVLATGGGAILFEENRVALQQTGFVVYLKCSIDRILERTKRDANRPLLQTENPRARIKSLFIEREPLYLKCADYQIDTGAMPNKVVVSRILEKYHARSPQI
ncbi:MAG: shikimate kinase [Methylobacter sp.]|nr:MAG: shikimate kinase [Methylobacter sp.]